MIPSSALETPFYEGSVQRLFAAPDDDSLMVTETTSRGSVFDVGALFAIEGNDVNRALFRHVLYTRMGSPDIWNEVAAAIEGDEGLDPSCREELLSGPLASLRERGARTHHEGMLDADSGEVVTDGVPVNPSARNVVRRYQILKPERADFFGAHLFDYSRFPHEDGFVVPLEYIVRFGITSASSVYRKYRGMNEAAREVFERELGTDGPLEAWSYLRRPISDFTSKFEPEDRMVSQQEALAMSGLTGDQFVESGQLAVLGAWAVRTLVERVGLRMWDIKWEFARDGDDLVFVDTIDTDSFRATLFIDWHEERYVCHCNKQAMRDYFTLLHEDWIAHIAEAKARGREEGVAFTEILEAGQAEGRYAETPGVEPEFLDAQVEKMTAIREFMLDRAEPEAVRERLVEAGRREIEFYREKGVLERLREMNGIPG